MTYSSTASRWSGRQVWEYAMVPEFLVTRTVVRYWFQNTWQLLISTVRIVTTHTQPIQASHAFEHLAHCYSNVYMMLQWEVVLWSIHHVPLTMRYPSGTVQMCISHYSLFKLFINCRWACRFGFPKYHRLIEISYLSHSDGQTHVKYNILFSEKMVPHVRFSPATPKVFSIRGSNNI